MLYIIYHILFCIIYIYVYTCVHIYIYMYICICIWCICYVMICVGLVPEKRDLPPLMAMLCWEHDDNDRRLDFLGLYFQTPMEYLNFSWTHPHVSCIIHSQNWPKRWPKDVANRTGGQVGFHFHHHIVPGNLSWNGNGDGTTWRWHNMAFSYEISPRSSGISMDLS